MIRSRLVFAACSALAASSASASDLNGVWLRGDGNARVRIAPCGSQICATNVWVKDPGGSEAVGDKLVMTLTKQGDTTYVGSAEDPKRGWTMSMTIEVAGKSFVSKGCVLRVACRTVNWTAAN